MLDPSRLPLNAETVGFRKRMRQPVDEAAFNLELQRQTDCIKVRREEKETPITEVHVMGGQLFGIGGDSKTNEFARQQRQINGYPLRQFSADGPIVLPSKHIHGLLQTPANVGLTQYVPRGMGVVGDYVSRNTEPNITHMGGEGFSEKRDLMRLMEESHASRQANLAAWQNVKSRNYQNQLARASRNGVGAGGRIEAVVDNPQANLPVGVRNVPIRVELGAEHAAALAAGRARTERTIADLERGQATKQRRYIAELYMQEQAEKAREAAAQAAAQGNPLVQARVTGRPVRIRDLSDEYLSNEPPPNFIPLNLAESLKTPQKASRGSLGAATTGGSSTGGRSTGRSVGLPSAATEIYGRPPPPPGVKPSAAGVRYYNIKG